MSWGSSATGCVSGRSDCARSRSRIEIDDDDNYSSNLELRLHYKDNSVGECRRDRPLAEGHVGHGSATGASGKASVEHATWRHVKGADGYIKHTGLVDKPISMKGEIRDERCVLPSYGMNRTFQFMPCFMLLLIPPVHVM